VSVSIPTVINSAYLSFLTNARVWSTLGATNVDSRKTIDTAAMGLMVLVCLVWALQHIGLKATAEFASPVLQVGLRSCVAAALVFLLVSFQRQSIELIGKTAVLGIAAGVLFAVVFILVGEALKHTSASHVVVFLYTAPI